MQVMVPLLGITSHSVCKATDLAGLGHHLIKEGEVHDHHASVINGTD